MRVICVKGQYAELTEGARYRVYGFSGRGLVVRNDAGLLLAYGNEFFAAETAVLPDSFS